MSYELILPFFPEELRELLLDPSISDLMINGTTGVYADRGGVVEAIRLSTPYTNERLQAAIERVARILGQDLTSQNPILNTRLPDGSRVAVVGAPSSINGPTFTVRKFNHWFTSDELIASGSLPESIRDMVVGFIAQRKNGIISGGTGSGKTTLMKALLDHIPLHERLVVIEQPAELKIAHPNAVRWEAVEAIPGQVAVTPSQLVAAALRHRPDRIIMGERRDECGYDLLQAMNTGHGGTLSTIRAKSAWDALNRLSDLGVITMGVKHANRIQALLDRELTRHPELAEFFDTGKLERFFVKNLERVQGDERDAIILSVGYGKDRAGNLPLRFGPILSAGGRRRLNVATTRAKAQITAISSFAYSDIDSTKVRPGTGLEFLKNYLQYAASGGKILSSGDLTNEPMNDFEADVAEALNANGISVVSQLGCSKYRIDLAAVHPTEPGRYVLAIECDGATYHSSYTARDRDRLCQQQLENLGWKFHRIWSTDWFMRKHEEVQRAVEAFWKAVEASDRPKAPRAPEQPTPSPGANDNPKPNGRSMPYPPIRVRQSITEYSDRELRNLLEWVQSDGRLRTNEEIVDEMFDALPFSRRGARIEEALNRAIHFWERSKAPQGGD